jgi:hypothetical protein
MAEPCLRCSKPTSRGPWHKRTERGRGPRRLHHWHARRPATDRPEFSPPAPTTTPSFPRGPDSPTKVAKVKNEAMPTETRKSHGDGNQNAQYQERVRSCPSRDPGLPVNSSRSSRWFEHSRQYLDYGHAVYVGQGDTVKQRSDSCPVLHSPKSNLDAESIPSSQTTSSQTTGAVCGAHASNPGVDNLLSTNRSSRKAGFSRRCRARTAFAAKLAGDDDHTTTPTHRSPPHLDRSPPLVPALQPQCYLGSAKCRSLNCLCPHDHSCQTTHRVLISRVRTEADHGIASVRGGCDVPAWAFGLSV